MSEKFDKNKELEEIQNSQASLVNALESIKGLLEQSETKLSAARESLAGSRIEHKPILKAKPEPVVPVLDDIVHPAPVITDTTVPAPESAPPSHLDTNIPNTLPLFQDMTSGEELNDDMMESYKEDLLQAVDKLQAEMEDEINCILARTMANAELEIRSILADKLQTLRQEIEKDQS